MTETKFGVCSFSQSLVADDITVRSDPQHAQQTILTNNKLFIGNCPGCGTVGLDSDGFFANLYYFGRQSYYGVDGVRLKYTGPGPFTSSSNLYYNGFEMKYYAGLFNGSSFKTFKLDKGNLFTSGFVSIGESKTNSISNYPAGFGLYVESGILVERVELAIKTTSNWADFVFADDYKLRPLSEVAAFIEENNHLPDVPSATEMVANGLDVATTDAILLQKIEELTLYLIAQQKEIELLKAHLINQ